MAFLTMDDLLTALDGVTSRSDARAMISRAARAARAARVAGVRTGRPLEVRELLMVCEALAAEGGAIQTLAESVTTRALRP